MLATAGEQSSRKDASGTSTGKRTKLDILADAVKPASPKPKSSTEQKKIAESIAKELSRWEKVVFSFDMDRNAGRSASGSGQRGDEEDNSNPRRQAQASSRSSSSSGAYPNQPHPFPNHPGSQNAAFPSFQQAPHLSGQQEQYHHQIGAPGLGGLDPYVLQQLAAISAMSGAPPQGSHQVQDPFSSLRQMQNALHQGNHGPSDAYSGLPRGFPQAGPSGSSHTPSSHIPLPQGIPNQALLNSPAGLQWLAHVQSMQQPQQTAHPPSLLHGYGGHDQRQGQRQQQIAPLTFPGSAYPQQTQSSGAGPSRARGSIAGSSSGGSSRAASASSPSPVSPAAALSRGQGDMDEAAIAEDKRRRNTAASARFRIKKKHKTMALERSVVELESRAEDLEREAADLRRENGWLKEMLIMKGRKARAAALEATEEDEDESSGEDEEEDNAEDTVTPAPDPKGKGKGKQKEKEK